jgi:hypothetical protein
MEEPSMMALHHDAAHRSNRRRRRTSDQAKLTITLEAERVLHDSALIDQAIAEVFERLGQVAVELRLRETTEAAHTIG